MGLKTIVFTGLVGAFLGAGLQVNYIDCGDNSQFSRACRLWRVPGALASGSTTGFLLGGIVGIGISTIKRKYNTDGSFDWRLGTWGIMVLWGLYTAYPPLIAANNKIIEKATSKVQDFIDPYPDPNNYSPQLKAFLDTISQAETGRIDQRSYTVVVFEGSDRFTLEDMRKGHPFVEGGRKASENCAPVLGKMICSSAAGRYQVLDRNYRYLKGRGYVKNFTPLEQDKIAVYYIRQAGALKDVEGGRFEVAITKINRIWASMPGSPYNQPTRSMAELKRFYQQRLSFYQAQS